MTTRAIALAFVAVLGLVGCTTGDTGGSPSTTPSTTPSTRDSARPGDRDEDAVLAAVRQLDLCALLDRAKAGGPFAGARPVARRPFECVLSGAADLVAVSVTGIGHGTRVESVTRSVGGAKAYVEQGGGCYVHLPVSFTTALRFSQAPASNCASLTGLADAAVAALANPDTFRAKPVWDACTALAGVLDADDAALSGNGPADCTSREPAASISFADDLPPSGERKPSRTTSIGGTRALVYEEAENCAVYWRQGPFDVRYGAAADFQVVARTSECGGATDLAESLMAVLGEAPPDDVAPQRPLLYRPDEPDSPYPGACAYVDELDPDGCAPYVAVAVPDDPAEILSAAADDADVQCAMAVRSVGARFGSELVPVADSGAGTRCFFVEPERRLQITFSLSHGKVVNSFGGEPVTISGHPGYVTTDGTSIAYELSTATILDGEGTLTLRVSTGPADADPLARAMALKADSVLADVLDSYFS
ncbi:hypothetical protein [Actinophytocola gossypii]|uniref:DUF3558 domain-containing protein n=1 Tax=Actinophytocola gossypii TaxID=2812003 RepID=A0ABT2JGM4_9PSEU|nr:hypothetical protein [Actinophytocola gossypii]MCT2586893.1 hypothetical protein [Actinophytocola gossypii]